MPKALYLCYFSLREPLVQTQVLPYLREIKKGGIEIFLLTFEPNPQKNWTKEQLEAEKRKLADEGIYWDFLTYHKKPSVPATLFDILCGAFYAWRLARKQKIDIFHARVHVPAMMGALARLFILDKKKPKLLFDIRGFFPEEYVDAGIWKENGLIYKSAKKVERWLIKQSDGFVVLTERAREILFPESKETGYDIKGRPVEVIPCCVDFNRFSSVDENLRQKMRQKLNLQNRFVIVYAGALGGWYMTEETARFFETAKQRYPNVFAMVLTQSNPEKIKKLLLEKGFKEEDFLIRKVSVNEIPSYLSACDVAISFIKPCYSKQASSPTKNAEYLICGLPIVSNDGIGDTSLFINEDKTGVIMKDFSKESYEEVLRKIEEMLKERDELSRRCVESAKKRFDLEKVGGERYRRLYARLLNIT
ncbi:MAG: glycosyltransferase family 4 protein, partial [Pyrinomonadaceae bacterium]|nr:glycosyltransferase family 4 protein [Pyrinomonadaceae bacterium]MDW8305251.1 glycosyltransferase family 4 protein [Acidobacteriota bacterium]